MQKRFQGSFFPAALLGSISNREKIKLSSVCPSVRSSSVTSSSVSLFVEGVSVVYNNCSVNTVLD